MTIIQKNTIISKVEELLDELLELDTNIVSLNSIEKEVNNVSTPDNKVEMLTIKECTTAVKGLSEHTVRQLVAQDKLPYIRTGQGKRGKILVSKSALLNYLGGVACSWLQRYANAFHTFYYINFKIAVLAVRAVRWTSFGHYLGQRNRRR